MTLTQTALMFIYPLVTGLGVGFFFYGGLWLILRRLQQFRHPGTWMALSLAIRTLVVVLVLYLLFGASWQQLLIAIAGMLVSRIVLVQRIKPGPRHSDTAGGTAQ